MFEEDELIPMEDGFEDYDEDEFIEEDEEMVDDTVSFEAEEPVEDELVEEKPLGEESDGYMQEEPQQMSASLQKESDEVFSDEERIMNMLKVTSDMYTRTRHVINLKEVCISEPLKLGREITMVGLTKSVKELAKKYKADYERRYGNE